MVSDNIDVTFHCDGLSDRKQWLIGESDIMVALPGSIGTLDEAFSAMAENTFGLHGKKVVFWNINGFWDDFFKMLEGLKANGVMTKPFDNVMLKVDTLEELVEILGK
jgi:predicted Rossmann-fold nucleotide-binding protein